MSINMATSTSAPSGIDAFTEDAIKAFDTYLQTSKSRTIFDPLRRAQYRNWLANPEAQISKMLSAKEQHRLRAEKSRALHGFHLRNHQLYRNAEKSYGDRVVATTYDAARHIIRIHEAIGHPGVRKTHQKLVEEVYGIS